MDDLIIPDLPPDIITEILLKLPLKPLLKFKCVSKSWLAQISCPEFGKNHLKLAYDDPEFKHHRVIMHSDVSKNFEVCPLSPIFTQGTSTEVIMHSDVSKNFEVCSLSPIFTQGTSTEFFDIDSPVGDSSISSWMVSSVNGLILLLNHSTELSIWNPTIRRCKKLPASGVKPRTGCTISCKYGLGYDGLNDEYKVLVFALYRYGDDSSYDVVVTVYSLRRDSWRTIKELPGNFLVSYSGKSVKGKLYWTSSDNTRLEEDVCNIISFDLANETWGRLELPSYGERNEHLALGVMGSDLSLICSSRQATNTSDMVGSVIFDVWVMKDCGVNVSWTKIFSTTYGLFVDPYMFSAYSFSLVFCKSHKDKVLPLFPPIVAIHNANARSIKTGFETCFLVEVYVESLVDPLLIAGQGIPNHDLRIV